MQEIGCGSCSVVLEGVWMPLGSSSTVPVSRYGGLALLGSHCPDAAHMAREHIKVVVRRALEYSHFTSSALSKPMLARLQ